MKGWRERIRQISFLRFLLLLSSWFFQGIRNSDNTEKNYKILFSIVLTIIFSIVLNFGENEWLMKILLSFICAHTFNWIINGPIAAIFIHRLYIGKAEKRKIFNYLHKLKDRLKNADAISYCGVYGSIARGELKNSSDIDVGFLRKPGVKYAFKGLYFITKERIITNLTGIPFEGYLVDSLDSMIARFNNESSPVILKQPLSVKSNLIISGISLEDALNLNNL